MKIKGWVIVREGYGWPKGLCLSDQVVFATKREALREAAQYFLGRRVVRRFTGVIEEPKRKEKKA